MKPEIAIWLRGMIRAINELATAVEHVVQTHCPDAAEVLRRIEYTCNEAERIIEEVEHA